MNTLNIEVQVHDLMTRNVITVNKDTPVMDIAQLLIAHRIGSLPVLDSSGQLVGMISKNDLYWKEERISAIRQNVLSLFHIPVLPQLLSELYARRGSKLVAADIMQPKAAWVGESQTLGDAIQRMLHHKVNSLPVLSGPPEGGGRLVGILSRSDIIAHLIRRQQADANFPINLSKMNSV